MDGALMEIGPYRVEEDGSLEDNPGSWHQYTNVVFVDQPLGVGLGTVDDDGLQHELEPAAQDFLLFLDMFFETFPEYLDTDIYIAGESYAGQYIPHITKAALDRNRELRESDPGSHGILNLQGIMIGNGWIDPVRQYLSYLPFMYEAGILEQGTDLARSIEDLHKKCADELAQVDVSKVVHVPVCERISNEALQKWSGDGKTCFNIYRVDLEDSYPACGMNWPPDLPAVTTWLRREDVMRALNTYAPDKQWDECVSRVHGTFTARNSTSAYELLPDILEEIPVMMFNGDKDYICNHLGNEQLIAALEWNGALGFSRDLMPSKWSLNDVEVGEVTAERNLTYVRVYDSSHMLAFDQPLQARVLVNVFTGLSDWSASGDLVHADEGLRFANGTASAGNGDSTSETDKKVQDATWRAYYRAGTTALIVVLLILAAVGGYWWWSRRQAQAQAGRSVHFGDLPGSSTSLLGSFLGAVTRWKPRRQRKGNYVNLQEFRNAPRIVIDDPEDVDTLPDRV